MRFFGESVSHWGSYGSKQGNPLKSFKNHSQLPNIYFCHHFLLRFLIVSRSTELRFDYIDIFFSKRWDYLRIVSDIDSSTAWNRVIPFKILKIDHNHLMCLFYYYFLLHFLIISRYTEFIFDYIDIFWVIVEVLWGECRPLM